MFHVFFLLPVSLVDTVSFVLSSWPSLLRSWCWLGPNVGRVTPQSQHLWSRVGTTLRQRAGAVISAQLGPGGTRKYVGEKFPLPHGGEDVGGARAEDGEQRWEDVSGPRCVHHPRPRGAG